MSDVSVEIDDSGVVATLEIRRGPNNFFDIGIDQNGNLFLNGPSSTATNHILSVSPTGAITIP